MILTTDDERDTWMRALGLSGATSICHSLVADGVVVDDRPGAEQAFAEPKIPFSGRSSNGGFWSSTAAQ